VISVLYMHTVYVHIYLCIGHIVCMCGVVLMGAGLGDGRVGGWIGGSMSGWTLGVWMCGLCVE
jgi:hypothetical protein